MTDKSSEDRKQIARRQDLHTWIETGKARPMYADGPGLNPPDTWVSPRHRYFCMTIPKTACSKIKFVLQELEGLPLPPDPFDVHERNTPGYRFVPSLVDFATAEGVEILTSNDWFRFAFVRNPYARLFSAYKQKVLDLTSPYISFREAIRQHAGYPTLPGGTAGNVGFADFVHYIATQPDELRDGHWKSQIGTLHLDVISYDFIGRVETFKQDFTQVLQRFQAPPALLATLTERVNTTVKLPLAVAYNKALADLVYTIYRNDFEQFTYPRESWLFID